MVVTKAQVQFDTGAIDIEIMQNATGRRRGVGGKIGERMKKARNVGMFGQWLKRCREGQRLTCTKLASMTGTHKGYISGIESGAVNPPAAKLTIKLAVALKTDPKHALKMAWVDKAPKLIQEDLKRVVFGL